MNFEEWLEKGANVLPFKNLSVALELAWEASRQQAFEDAAKRIEQQKYMTLQPFKTSTATEVVRACRGTGESIANMVRRMK
jgi:DNA-binding SARP family transcriptional activator